MSIVWCLSHFIYLSDPLLFELGGVIQSSAHGTDHHVHEHNTDDNDDDDHEELGNEKTGSAR